MGNIRQTGIVNTVNINSSSSSSSRGGSDALILGLCVLVGAYVVLAAAAAIISALMLLLIWASVVLGLTIVLAVVLAVVFRKRIGTPWVTRVGEASLLREPDRDMRKPEAPREVIHTHRHFVMGPGTVYAAPAGSDWTKLGDFDVVEAEILP